jgi:hypothetical protein
LHAKAQLTAKKDYFSSQLKPPLARPSSPHTEQHQHPDQRAPTLGELSASMVPPAVDSAVQSALANQQYDRVAAILDAAELEVRRG